VDSYSQTVAYFGLSDIQSKVFILATKIKKLIAKVVSLT